MSAAKNRAPSGSIIPEMSDHRLIEYREELIAEIASDYTTEIAMTTRLSDFNDLKEYCRRRLNAVNEEGMARFIKIHNGDPE